MLYIQLLALARQDAQAIAALTRAMTNNTPRDACIRRTRLPIRLLAHHQDRRRIERLLKVLGQVVQVGVRLVQLLVGAPIVVAVCARLGTRLRREAVLRRGRRRQRRHSRCGGRLLARRHAGTVGRCLISYIAGVGLSGEPARHINVFPCCRHGTESAESRLASKCAARRAGAADIAEALEYRAVPAAYSDRAAVQRCAQPSPRRNPAIFVEHIRAGYWQVVAKHS